MMQVSPAPHPAHVFQITLNLREAAAVLEQGFAQGISAEGSRLEVQSKFDLGPMTFYVAGRFYSWNRPGEFQAWLQRFSSDKIAEWAREADGDFMLIAWERDRQRAVLISDRNGANRVYYTRDRDSVSFSNSLFDIARLAAAPHIDPFTAFTLLVSFYGLDPYTLIESVQCTAPGEIVALGLENTAVASYYLPVSIESEYFSTLKESVQALGHSFNWVFQKRVSESRTPCVLLSGGIDSVAMLRYVSEFASGRVHSLTFSVRGQAVTEHQPARLAAAHFNSRHHELIVEPADAAALYLQCFEQRSTPNVATMLALAHHNFLCATGLPYDVYSGEDTRLHTPDFDLPKELGIRLNLLRNPSPASLRLRSLLARILEAWPVYPKNYLKYWAHAFQPPVSRDLFALQCLSKLGGPSGYSLASSPWLDKFVRELPPIAPDDNLQTIFKKHIAAGYRLQYTDNMIESMLAINRPQTALQMPFYDWETVAVANRIPYRIGKKGVFTLRTWSKFPLVNKRVLRQCLEGSVPKSILYRRKATAGALDVFITPRLLRLLDLILSHWLPDLLLGLNDEVAGLVRAYLNDFRRAPSLNAAGQRTVYAVLNICHMAVLNQVCIDRGFNLDEQMRRLYEMSAHA